MGFSKLKTIVENGLKKLKTVFTEWRQRSRHRRKAIVEDKEKSWGFCSWLALRGWGRSKLLRSSYFWLFFVPVSANVLLWLRDKQFQVLGETISLATFDLPFSWKFAFFASVFFSIASLIFTWKCPPLISDYENPADFQAQGKVPFQIWDFLVRERERVYADYSGGDDSMEKFWLENVPTDLAAHKARQDADYDEMENQTLRNKYGGCPADNVEPDPVHQYSQTSWHRPITDEHFKLLFDAARREMSTHQPWVRITCAGLYAVGFLLLLVIAGQNIWAVCKLAWLASSP